MRTLFLLLALLGPSQAEGQERFSRDDLLMSTRPMPPAPELGADRVGMTIICAAGVPRARASSPFEESASTALESTYLKSHDDPLERKVVVSEWARGRNLVCLD